MKRLPFEIEHYRLPLKRRVRRFFRNLWRFLTAPSPEIWP